MKFIARWVERLFEFVNDTFVREVASPETILDLIVLTGDDDAYGVTVEEIRGWSRSDQIAVERWAILVHMRGRCYEGQRLLAVPTILCERHAEAVAKRCEGA